MLSWRKKGKLIPRLRCDSGAVRPEFSGEVALPCQIRVNLATVGHSLQRPCQQDRCSDAKEEDNCRMRHTLNAENFFFLRTRDEEKKVKTHFLEGFTLLKSLLWESEDDLTPRR